MKDASQITACVVDHGRYLGLAVELAKSFKRVLYYNAAAVDAFPTINKWTVADGFPGVEVIVPPDDHWDHKSEIDLYVFPDIYHGGEQLELESQGKLVWGSRHGDRLEILRGQFLKTLPTVGLQVPKHKVIHGLTDLRAELAHREDVYVKISRYRGTSETFHWRDWDHDEVWLDEKAIELGPQKDEIIFYVFDKIETDIEVGLDTYSVDGDYPAKALVGYEWKDKGYFGAVTPLEDAPHQLTRVAVSFATELRSAHYRNFISSEVRIKGDEFYFIDPTRRMPCYSDDTEVLTRRGWLRFDHLSGSDEVCTLNPKTETIEYHIPRVHLRYPFHGEMILISNRRKDLELLVTPDHRVWGYSKKGDLRDVAASELPESFSIPRSGVWNRPDCATYVIPAYENSWHSGKGKGIDKQVQFEAKVVPMDAWLRFLAIYLSEGSSRKHQVVIAQSKYKRQIANILAELPFDFKPFKGGFRLSNVQLAHHLSPLGNRYEKQVPDYVKSVSARQIDIFLDAYCLGDGSIAHGNRRITTPSAKTADDLQELFLKSGSLATIRLRSFTGKVCAINPQYLCHHDTYEIRERRQKTEFYLNGWKSSRSHLYLSKVPYQGTVYDVEVENHILFVRRNGKPCWSGNCPASASQLKLYGNLPEIILAGAGGELVQPQMLAKFACECVVTTAGGKDAWKTTRLPESLEDSFVGQECCMVDGKICWAPMPESHGDELGWLVNTADTPKDCLRGMLEKVAELPDGVTAATESLASLLKEIESGQAEGVPFTTQPLPKPAAVIDQP